MKNFVTLFWLIVFFMLSCKTTNKEAIHKTIPVTIYAQGEHHIGGLRFFSEDRLLKSIKRKYNEEKEAPKTHDHTLSYFLREFLSVRNRNWYQKMFYNGEVFIPSDFNLFANRNRGKPESYEIIKGFGIYYRGNSYKIIKLRHSTSFGDIKIVKMILRYDNDKQRYYLIEKSDDPDLEHLMDVFYKLKHEIGWELTKVDIHYNFPPSGNKILDEYVNEAVYENFRVGYRFNISRFMATVEQWEKDGKTGLLNYFFEN